MNTLDVSAEYLLKRSSLETKFKAAIESYNIRVVKVAAVGIPMNIVHSVFNGLHEVLNVFCQMYSTVQYSTVLYSTFFKIMFDTFWLLKKTKLIYCFIATKLKA
jgi:hypothetical protein